MENQGYVVYGIKEKSENIIDLLKRFQKPFKFVDIERDGHALGFLAKSGLKPSVHVYYNDKYVGGYNELSSHIFTN